jgi:hypothetical protein
LIDIGVAGMAMTDLFFAAPPCVKVRTIRRQPVHLINAATKRLDWVSVMIDVAKISGRMPVISSDDRVIGVVSHVGPQLSVTCLKNGCGFDHLFPIDWIEAVGSSVFLNKSRRFLETHCTDAACEDEARRKAA